MTAPRKPVAWTDPRGLERLMDGKQELVSGEPTSADDTVALYTATDLQPLWALVEKWMAHAAEADGMATDVVLSDRERYDYWANFAATKRNMARELQGTLEAMQ